MTAQEFFAINLEREGYGRTSFGLDLTNEGKLNIITITGQQGKSAYPYSGGGGVVVTELEAYFNQHPDKKKSEHTLVLLPSTSGRSSKSWRQCHFMDMVGIVLH